MYLFRKIWNWCKRYRHRCGYGVHSPSDFFLITYVIYEKQPYYAYGELKKQTFLDSLPHYRTKVNRLLFRLVNYCHPHTLLEVGSGNGSSFDYMKAARPSVETRSIEGTERETLLELDEICSKWSRLDFVHIGFTPYYRESLQRVLSKVNNQTCVVVGDIYETPEKEAWWKEVTADERVRISYDLYDVGLLFFEKNRYKQHYIINFL